MAAISATDRRAVFAAAIALGFLGGVLPAGAQQWMEIGGRIAPPAWGRYQNTIGAGSPAANQIRQPYDPVGSVLRSQEIGTGGGTVASPFTPRDNRLLGRTVF